MNNSFRQQIQDILEDFNTEPLTFATVDWNCGIGDFGVEPVEVTDLSIKKVGLQAAIINVLTHSMKYASIIHGQKYYETMPNCLRSALDIWRHLKKYNPEVSIFDVMRCLGNYCGEMELYSHFCPTIERRVFHISDDDEFPCEINDDDIDDEFGLELSNWSEL